MKQVGILTIVGDIKMGGMGRVIYRLATRLKHKYRLAVWCLLSGGYFADELQKEGVEVRVLRRQSWRHPLNLIRLANQMRQGRFQILHSHGDDASTIGRVASLIAGMPIRVVHLHTAHWLPSERSKKQVTINKFLSAFTDEIIACSHAGRTYTINDEHIHPGRVTTIHNGISVERFNVSSTRHQPTLGITPETPVVGTIARLEFVKGHEYLFEAAKIVLKQFPQTRFLIIGDGPRRTELERLVAELDISSNVIFLGIRFDVPELLSLCDVFVLPTSIREGLPLVLAEAMAASKPIVGTRVGGVPEVIVDGETGFIVPPKDTQALADKILLLLQNPTVARRLGDAGRQLCMKAFSDTAMAQRVENLYDELIARKLHS
ncbi:glycosyltransferase [Candidatus Poribacteria bacterium]|nr:glycosyltransferase [Candidatus Poribacteria bacterium]